MSINELFKSNESNDAAANARSLAGTAQLTSTSTAIANQIIKYVEEHFEEYKDLVAKSKADHNMMDQLITATYDLSDVDIQFLKELDETTLDNMLKSQQSKRSRSKGKVMTMDNYRAMMTGAIAETLIRLATGKSKFATGMHRTSGSNEYTAEQLEELKNDPEKLRKEIRNVQSKKSIMKSKEDFSEQDERWQQLLVVEEQLKGLRSDTKTVVVDATKNQLAELLKDKDLNALSTDDMRALLEQAQALANASAESEETTTDDDSAEQSSPNFESVVETQDENPADETPAEEVAPTVEAPVEDVPAEETVQEQPSEEKPAEDLGGEDEDALKLVNNRRNRKH